MKQEKKGFTLIELMVVIVIIGILAAIAIPKLFGMSAKAKASEVGPAAGTWSKLLQAYILETSVLGDGKAIGYTPPGAKSSGNTGATTNFSYLLSTVGTNATWNASNATQLNDCNKGTSWNVVASLDGGAQSATYTIMVGTETLTSGSTPTDDCGVLTPNFGKLQ